MKTLSSVAVAAVLMLNIQAPLAKTAAEAKPQTKPKTAQGYLNEIVSPKDLKNIHVQKLASDKNSSDFVVFIRHNVPLHQHLTHSETVYVLEGTGVFQYGDEKVIIGPGHYIKIPQGTPHGVTVTSAIPLKVLSIQAPEFFGKDRIAVKP